MAVMNINIINPVIDLIHNQKEVSSNSCFSIFEFEILSTPNASVGLFVADGGTYGADSVKLNYNGNWIDLDFSTGTYYVFNLNITGKAKVRLSVGNAPDNPFGKCNKAIVHVKDYTNTIPHQTQGDVPRHNQDVFERCNKQPRCEEDITEPPIETEIDAETNLVFIFDGSGSMSGTLQPLQEMRDTILKTTLLPYYNNDSAAYDAKVKVVTISSLSDPLYEKTFKMLNYENQVLTGKRIVMVFQDEADEYTGGSTFSPYNSRSPIYDSDLSELRMNLLSHKENYYFGVIFQVTDDTTDGANFKAMLQACKGGVGNYSGSNGLSDKSNIKVKYDITDGGTASYYKNLVVDTLNEFGFTV